MRKKRIALKLLRWFIESGLACFMIIALITLLFGEELHWRKACVNAIVLAVLITLLRVKRKYGNDIMAYFNRSKRKKQGWGVAYLAGNDYLRAWKPYNP